jgi:hypothetical protein
MTQEPLNTSVENAVNEHKRHLGTKKKADNHFSLTEAAIPGWRGAEG